MIRKYTALLAGFLLLMLLSGCERTHTVTFDLNGGELVAGETEQTVVHREGAVAPAAVNGVKALSWDRAFDRVTRDMTVTANWSRVPAEAQALAEYVQPRTVSVIRETTGGQRTVVSGFFISGSGTVVTGYGAVENASALWVRTADGTEVSVKLIPSFDAGAGIAVLETGLKNTPWLELSRESAAPGDRVYAAGAVPRMFTAGTLSSAGLQIGQTAFLAVDAPAAPGGRGGPLVNVYGEVVGIHTAYTLQGSSVAADAGALAGLDSDRSRTVARFGEWYAEECDGGYWLWDGKEYAPSPVETYHAITGAECLGTVLGEEMLKEYAPCGEYYIYEHAREDIRCYGEYLTENGFVLRDTKRFRGGSSVYFFSPATGVLVDLYLPDVSGELWLWITRE